MGRTLDPADIRRALAAFRPEAEGERRGDVRFPLANTDLENHLVRGSLVEMSRGGLSIEAHEALSPGQAYTFTLKIGEYEETLRGRVLWCRLRATRKTEGGDVLPVYRAGISRVRA